MTPKSQCKSASMDLDSRNVGGGQAAATQRQAGVRGYMKRLQSTLRFRRTSKPSKRYNGDNAQPAQDTKKPDRPGPILPAQTSGRDPARETSATPDPPAHPIPAYGTRSYSVPVSSQVTRANTAAASLAGSDSEEPLAIQDYRARRATQLFERYGMELDLDLCPHAISPASPNNIERVEKPVRLRVHNHCHKCGLALGPSGICINCGHKLCKKCLRYPDSKEAKPSKSEQKRRKTPSPTRSETLDNWLASTPAPLALRPAAGDLTITGVCVTRRLRTLCHRCSAPFIWSERKCQDCGHRMCSECPSETPTDSPDGPMCGFRRHSMPPRNRTLKQPRLRVKYTCDQCHTLIPEKTDFCSCCGHLRCKGCFRDPPPRSPPAEPDPQALRSVERRLAGFTTAVASDP